MAEILTDTDSCTPPPPHPDTHNNMNGFISVYFSISTIH